MDSTFQAAIFNDNDCRFFSLYDFIISCYPFVIFMFDKGILFYVTLSMSFHIHNNCHIFSAPAGFRLFNMYNLKVKIHLRFIFYGFLSQNYKKMIPTSCLIWWQTTLSYFIVSPKKFIFIFRESTSIVYIFFV